MNMCTQPPSNKVTESLSDKYAPPGRETGTDFPFKKRANPRCVQCSGFGEFHVPYVDYDTFIIHRCECTDEVTESPSTKSLSAEELKERDRFEESIDREGMNDFPKPESLSDRALEFGYSYARNPSMRGTSLHACRLEWAQLNEENKKDG